MEKKPIPYPTIVCKVSKCALFEKYFANKYNLITFAFGYRNVHFTTWKQRAETAKTIKIVMKRTFLLPIFCLFALCLQAQCELKLMSYNIRNGVGMDSQCDYKRVADIILKNNPDVVMLQELDSVTARSAQRDVLGELAKLTNMHAVYSPAIIFQNGKYGIGMLSRLAPTQISRFRLPGREESRTMLVAEFEQFTYCGTHLSLTEEDRMASVEIIKDCLGRSKKPFFLAGDLNSEPSSRLIQLLCEDFSLLTDSTICTFPAPDPTVTIDYIMVNKNAVGVEKISSAVLDEPIASDHRPVLVTIKLPNRKTKE